MTDQENPRSPARGAPSPRLRHRHAARRAHRHQRIDDTADERHVIPRGLVHVGFRGLDTAPVERIPLREALRLRDVFEHEH